MTVACSTVLAEAVFTRHLSASPAPTTCMIFFFFQAEDGIRDIGVTGVQTCALPICARPRVALERGRAQQQPVADGHEHRRRFGVGGSRAVPRAESLVRAREEDQRLRSEERRVGKEGRDRWAPYH